MIRTTGSVLYLWIFRVTGWGSVGVFVLLMYSGEPSSIGFGDYVAKLLLGGINIMDMLQPLIKALLFFFFSSSIAIYSTAVISTRPPKKTSYKTTKFPVSNSSMLKFLHALHDNDWKLSRRKMGNIAPNDYKSIVGFLIERKLAKRTPSNRVVLTDGSKKKLNTIRFQLNTGTYI